jgi:hypothetical protein
MKVIYKKLGREKVFGYMDTDDLETIFVDSRLKGKKLMEVILHEAVHCLRPDWEEEEVVRVSTVLTRLLWEQGFRQVDNSDETPLQDELKK